MKSNEVWKPIPNFEGLYEVSDLGRVKAVKIPIIGLGGISNWKDAVEFMLAGATAIQIGTYNFVDPAVGIKVIEGMNDYCDRHGFSSVRELIGALEV